MNHRSNMDYVLVAFLAAELTALSYAVAMGAHLALAAAHPLDGAYFVRRNSNNPIYRRVLGAPTCTWRPSGRRAAMYPRAGCRATASCANAGRPVRLHAEIVRSQGQPRHRPFVRWR